MSKDRKRNKKVRESKRVILISYEGKNKTEKNYFNNFSGREKDYIIKQVPGNETDPINLVKQTIEKSKSLSLDLTKDKAFCVFDADTYPSKNKQIQESIKLAKDNNIIPIISTPCIELWFLLHFEYSTAVVSSSGVIKELKKYYPKYEKNCNIYLIIQDKIITAINNAKNSKNIT